jgi:hypothetical protein
MQPMKQNGLLELPSESSSLFMLPKSDWLKTSVHEIMICLSFLHYTRSTRAIIVADVASTSLRFCECIPNASPHARQLFAVVFECRAHFDRCHD